MPAYVESFVPPHRRRSLPLEYVSLDGLPGGLSDLSGCACGTAAVRRATGLKLSGLGDEPAPGLLQSLGNAIAGAVGGTGSIQNRIAKGVAGGTVRGAKFRSQFSSPVYLTPDQVFGGDQVAAPSQSSYSIMGVIKPGVELDTVAGVFKVFPWGEPQDGAYLLYLAGGAVAVVAIGVVGCKLLSKVT